MRLAIVVCVLALYGPSAHAQEDYAHPEPPRVESSDPKPKAVSSQRAPRTEVFGEFAVELGGDDVATLFFTDGESQTLTAGQGGTLAVGVRSRPAETWPVSAFGSVGVKFLFNASENADVRLIRFPIEVGAHARLTRDVWAEAAYTRHLGTTLYGDGFFADEDFSGTNGATLAAGWRWIGATATLMRYTADDGTEFDASNVGITLRLSSADFQ